MDTAVTIDYVLAKLGQEYVHRCRLEDRIRDMEAAEKERASAKVDKSFMKVMEDAPKDVFWTGPAWQEPKP
jgi:hypothetical protein